MSDTSDTPPVTPVVKPPVTATTSTVKPATYIANVPLLYKGKRYEAGSVVPLSDSESASLIKRKHVRKKES